MLTCSFRIRGLPLLIPRVYPTIERSPQNVSRSFSRLLSVCFLPSTFTSISV